MNGKFKHKHSLGQNFIIDEFIFDDIVRESGITKEDNVLEIGPGNGAMTRVLCEKAKFVVSVEIDKSLMPLLASNLKEYNNVSIINADFLNYDFEKILNEFKDKNAVIKVVANIPYYVTSPIIMSLLTNPYVEEATLMVQKEVAERIIAKVHSRDYGVLTIACNYFADTYGLFIVPRNSFYPVPKVDSAVVKFIKHKEFVKSRDRESKESFENDREYKELFRIVKAAFSQRRKKLINSLANMLSLDKIDLIKVFSECNFDENVRAEDLSIDDYRKLSRMLISKLSRETND